MQHSEPLIETQTFQTNAAFVRRLARRLIRDEAAAEDLAQDAWVAALERPPKEAGESGGLRAWLAAVMRNQASLRLRRRERRERRESLVARSEEVANTSELVERTELHARVVQATLDLPDAYRDVLLRHFWNEETPAEIATALDLPERTVRTRLRRGLERMRIKLRCLLYTSPSPRDS